MTTQFSGVERRCFGRRAVNYFGLLRSRGHPPLVCTVRNISRRGALLEVASPYVLSYEVRLVVDALGVDMSCTIRHQGRYGVGVEFASDLPTYIERRLPPATPREIARLATNVVPTPVPRVTGAELREQIFRPNADGGWVNKVLSRAAKYEGL